VALREAARLAQVESLVAEEHAIEELLAQAKVEDKAVTFQELLQLEAQPTEVSGKFMNTCNATRRPVSAGVGLIPMVIRSTGRGERAYDIYSRLLKEARSVSGRAGRGSYGEPGGGPTVVLESRIRTKIYTFTSIPPVVR